MNALILAGERPGGDPLARSLGVSHKAAIPIEGRPMLDHVAGALLGSAGIGRIGVSAKGGLGLLDPDRMAMLPAADTPSLSVRAAFRELGFPLLVTTADHPLLRTEWVDHFLDHLPSGADAVAALARADVVAGAEPTAKRTYLRFRGGAFSGCNLFFFATPESVRVVDFWRRIETHRKRPLKMARTIGPGAVIAYLAGRLTLDGALRRLGTRTGTRLAVVEMPFGEAAIDVDKESDLALARRIMAARGTPKASR